MAEDKSQPIIIKRKKHGGHGHHGGAWKVAFADFMTAMMAFFLVMWAVNQSEDVKAAIGGYFRDPAKFMAEGGDGTLKGGAGMLPEDAPQVTVTPIPPQNLPSLEEKERLQSAAQGILEQLSSEDEFQRLKENISMQLTSEGLRIILTESSDAPAFFEPGSAKLLQKSAVILITIARQLGMLRNHLVIEGHTDASPMGDDVYSNWNLSADRANAARELMQVSGLYDGQVQEVRGYADRLPMFSENPADPRNRRVTILVPFESDKTEFDEFGINLDLPTDSMALTEN